MRYLLAALAAVLGLLALVLWWGSKPRRQRLRIDAGPWPVISDGGIGYDRPFTGLNVDLRADTPERYWSGELVVPRA